MNQPASTRKRVHEPGAGLLYNWINPYTQSNTPFITGVGSAMILPANPIRSYVLIQNKNNAANMFINFGSSANVFNGIIIIPLGNYELIGGATGGAYCPRDSIHILGAAVNMQGVITEGIMPPSTPRLA